TLEVPDVGHGGGELDVAHALTTDGALGDLHAAALADDALEADTLVLATGALPVAGGAEDLLAEEAVLLRLQRAVVDRLGLLDLTVRPSADVVSGREADSKLIESCYVEHLFSWVENLSNEPRSDLVDRCGFETAGDVDAELLRRAEGLVIGVAEVHRGAVRREDLDVQAQRLHLLHEHLEGLGDARLLDVLALDDRLVHLDAAEDVVGLDREQLLQRVCGAVGLQRPHLHLTEALTTELRLTTERLLGDHRVRARRTRVDLVVDQVVQLQDVHVADRDRCRERLAGAAVEQLGLAGAVDQAHAVAGLAGRVQQTRDLGLTGTVEHRGRDLGVRGDVAAVLGGPHDPLPVALDLPAGLGDPPEVGLQHLAEVHPARDAERVEHHVDRRAVREERHVLDGEDLRDDALVAV